MGLLCIKLLFAVSESTNYERLTAMSESPSSHVGVCSIRNIWNTTSHFFELCVKLSRHRNESLSQPMQTVLQILLYGELRLDTVLLLYDRKSNGKEVMLQLQRNLFSKISWKWPPNYHNNYPQNVSRITPLLFNDNNSATFHQAVNTYLIISLMFFQEMSD